MRKFKCLADFSEIKSAKPDKDIIRFANSISSEQFDFSIGDTEEKANIDPSLLAAWETAGIVVPYVDKALEKEIISLVIHQVYTATELKGRISDLLERKIIEELGEENAETETEAQADAEAETEAEVKKGNGKKGKA